MFILHWPISDLEEVLHTFRVIAVTLSADPLHLFDLACLAGSLDIFEVNLWILAEVHNGTQEVEQTCKIKEVKIKRTNCDYLKYNF